jgi:hypothetical protein
MSATGLRLAVEADADKDQIVALQQPSAGECLPLGSAVAVQVHPARGGTKAPLSTVVSVPRQQRRDS